MSKALLLLLVPAMACNAIAGLEDLDFSGSGGSASTMTSTGGAPTTTTTTSTTTTGGGGEGGQPPPGPGDVLCSVTIPDNNDPDGIWFRDLAAAPDGRVALGGAFSGTYEFGDQTLVANMTDLAQEAGAVLIFDANCQPLMAPELSSSSGETVSVQGVEFDPDGNLFVAGFFHGSATFGGDALDSAGSADAFVSKIDASGQFVWTQRFGGASYDDALAISVGSSGDVVVAGTFRGAATFGSVALVGSAAGDVWIAKLDDNGDPMWVTSATGVGSKKVRSLSVAPSGFVALGGRFQGPMTFAGDTLPDSGTRDGYVLHVSKDGAPLWARALATDNALGCNPNEHNHVRHVAFDEDDDVLAEAEIDGPLDLPPRDPVTTTDFPRSAIVRFHPSGAVLEVIGADPPTLERVGSIAGTGSSVVFMGHTVDYSATSGARSLLVREQLKDGTELWSHSFPSGAAMPITTGPGCFGPDYERMPWMAATSGFVAGAGWFGSPPEGLTTDDYGFVIFKIMR